MNENSDLFQTGWNKVNETTPKKSVRLFRLNDSTREAYNLLRSRIRSLQHDSIGLTAIRSIDDGRPLQLDMFDYYITSNDVRK